MLSQNLPILSRTDGKILQLVKLLLALCLATPFFVTAGLLFPYTASKAFVFRIIIEISAAFYFYLALKYPSLRPQKTILFWAGLIFLALTFLSALFGVDFYLSFWGNLERMLGVWGIAHFVLFFLLLAALLKTGKEWRIFLQVSVSVSSLVALLAVIQKFAGLGNLIPQSDRVFGTIGNAGFLASYLVFNIFFIVYLFVSEKDRGWDLKKIGYIFALLLQLSALLLSGTRGALLGLFGGAIICLALFGFFSPQKDKRKYFVGALASMILLAGLVFIFRSSSLIQKNPGLQRLTTFSFNDAAAQNRLILWQRAWLAARERPIFGWGQENYEAALNKYFDPRLSPYESWYDRAHNFIFDYNVAGGLLGLLSYLGLAGAAAYGLFRISRQQPENFAIAALFGSLIAAYLIQNLFIFDTFASYLMLFFVLALINFVSQEANLPLATKKKPASFGSDKKIFVAVAVLLVCLAVYSLNIRPILASRLASQSLSLPLENYQEITADFQQALSLNTFGSGEIAYQICLDYLFRINQDPGLTQNEDFYKVASGALQETIERSPIESRNYIALAWLDLYFSDQHRQRIDMAIELGKKTMALSPQKKDAYLLLTAGYMLSGQNQQAQAVVEQAQNIDASMGEEVKKYWESLK